MCRTVRLGGSPIRLAVCVNKGQKCFKVSVLAEFDAFHDVHADIVH